MNEWRYCLKRIIKLLVCLYYAFFFKYLHSFIESVLQFIQIQVTRYKCSAVIYQYSLNEKSTYFPQFS